MSASARLALMPLPTEQRNIGQRDVPVHIHGVWMRPGDWLVADEDGIVVMAQPEWMPSGTGSSHGHTSSTRSSPPS